MSSTSRLFLTYLVIAIGGTAAFARIEHIQYELHLQQNELASHQAAITNQLKVNEDLRVERSRAITDAITKQCVQQYRIDGKLAHLGMDLLADSALDERVKTALADFSAEIAKSQGELQCSNPLTAHLKKGP